MIHRTWKLASKRGKARVAYYFSVTDFLKQAGSFNKSVRIFIDSQLSNEIRGEEVSREIAALGFHNIYLITGISKRAFPDLPHIKEIRDKTPPW